MSTFLKVSSELKTGYKIPSIRIGANGASLILAPSGLNASDTTPAVWKSDNTTLTFTGTDSTKSVSYGGYSALNLMNSGTTIPSLNLTGFTQLSRDFTFVLVSTAPPSYSYLAYFGNTYKMGASKSQVMIEGVGGNTSVSTSLSETKYNVFIARCSGSKSSITANGVTSTTNAINDTLGANTGPMISRNNLSSLTYIPLFAYFPRVLSIEEVSSVTQTQKDNFAKNIAF